MSKITEELILRNVEDIILARHGLVKKAEVREATVTFMADTGAHYNTLTEDVCKKLGLSKTGSRVCKLAGGINKRFDISSPAEIWWRDRSIPMPFIIVSEGATNLFSVTAMELLDLVPDPIQGKLVGAHGDTYITMME